MSRLFAGLAFVLLAGAAQQSAPPLEIPPNYNPTLNDPEVWKDKDFFAPEQGKKVFADSPPVDSLPPDGDRAWRRRDYVAAASDYQRQAAMLPQASEPWFDAALSYYRQGWRAEALSALDKAEPLARGGVKARCLLLRADLEYRDALTKQNLARIGGLGRALQMYRDVVASPDVEAGVARLAKYDIEVVKLRLLMRAPDSGSPPPPNAGSDGDPSPDDIAAAADSAPQPKGKAQEKPAQAKDW